MTFVCAACSRPIWLGPNNRWIIACKRWALPEARHASASPHRCVFSRAPQSQVFSCMLAPSCQSIGITSFKDYPGRLSARLFQIFLTRLDLHLLIRRIFLNFFSCCHMRHRRRGRFPRRQLLRGLMFMVLRDNTCLFLVSCHLFLPVVSGFSECRSVCSALFISESRDSPEDLRCLCLHCDPQGAKYLKDIRAIRVGPVQIAR